MTRRLPLQSVRRSLAAVACVSLCVPAACSGDPESGSSDSDASKGASTGVPGAGSTELPEVAAAPTTRGAVAFVEHWVGMLTLASNTGDTGPWRDLNEADCDACANLADGIDELYVSGGSLTSTGWRVLHVSATLRPAGARGGQVTGAVVRLRVNRTPETVQADAQSKAKIFRGGRRRYVVRLVRVEESWSVRAFTSARPEASRD